MADAIEAGIQAGDFLPDRPILSENQLVWKYGIARGAARKSIQLLRERRLVVTVVGGE
ncbi:GntR family transcriptional regulator [Actinoplanes sp. M2I2]|uniref:GntR family transcriptional regulator n=1 Tax=Actinoplanes sp. M2I2 TaxID=1734444 RepID=UPI0020226747|nr:GntR family transcriptional regulator [Actinoplanes sp. M2I2]